MTDSKMFREAVARNGLKYRYLAAELGLSAYGLQRKIENHTEFKASEIKRLGELLQLSKGELENIFFASTSDFKSPAQQSTPRAERI